MHGRLPFLARRHARAEARVAKHRRETMTAAVVRILAQGEPTKFAFEGACRHGLRSQLCLDGHAWAAADKFAAAIVGEALRRLGAVRPSWAQAQPDAALSYGTSRYFCANCGKPIPDRGSTNGYPVKYCSELCTTAASHRAIRISGEKMVLAERRSAWAAQTERTMQERAGRCDHCGRHFMTRKVDRKFCSHACFAAAQTVHAEQPCPTCGVIFKPKNSGPRSGPSKYCSVECFGIARRKVREERQCPRCLAIFKPRFPSRRFKSEVQQGSIDGMAE